MWLQDITEHRTGEGKLYLCAIKDVYSNWIVGYSVDALDSAVARRAAAGDLVAGCVVHSYRGSHFRSRKFLHARGRHAMTGSMGRVGACGDNAAMESFFALLQKNVQAAGPGPPATSSGSRSSPALNAPTTAADANARAGSAN